MKIGGKMLWTMNGILKTWKENMMSKQNDVLKQAEYGLGNIEYMINGSEGVSGYHKNGDVADWEYFQIEEDISDVRKGLDALFSEKTRKNALIFEVRDAMQLLDKKGMAYWLLDEAIKEYGGEND